MSNPSLIKLATAREVGDYDNLKFCRLYILLADEYITGLRAERDALIEKYNRDCAAYLGALGHPVLACYDGLLSDGTEPVNAIAENLARNYANGLSLLAVAGERLEPGDVVTCENGRIMRAHAGDA